MLRATARTGCMSTTITKGTIYAASAHYTVALDGATCEVIWQHQWRPKLREVPKAQRGVALKDGKVVRGSTDGSLYALDAKTGKELWSRQVADPADGYFISAPPLIVDDLIFIGPAGSESAGKGWVGAFKLSNGERVWKFNTVPDLGEPGAQTWGDNPKGLKTGGGAIWTAMSYDPEKHLLYVRFQSSGAPKVTHYVAPETDAARPSKVSPS